MTGPRFATCVTEAARRIPCPICKKMGNDSVMVETPGLLACDVCQTRIRIPAKNEIEALLADTERRLHGTSPALYLHQVPDLHGHLATAIEEAWFCIATGRHNAGIILLGVFVEAVLQEVLWVHRYEVFRGELASLASYLRHERLVDSKLLHFVDEFRIQIRNRWQHQKDHEIVEGQPVMGALISVDQTRVAESLIEAVKEVTEGTRPMSRMTTREHPALRSVIKMQMDQSISIPLFNAVWTWTLFVNSRYLRNKDFSGLHGKYDGPPVAVEFKQGKRRVIQIGSALEAEAWAHRVRIGDSLTPVQTLGRPKLGRSRRRNQTGMA